MNILGLTKISYKAIFINKIRTLLTMLGIIIGVASVIAMLAIGEGSKSSIKKQISSMGSNIINIRPDSEIHGGVHMGGSDMQSLKLKDYLLLKENAKLISAISPVVKGSGQLIYKGKNWPSSIYGVSQEYFSIKILELENGHTFTNRDIQTSAKVIVIGKTVAENLFPKNADPIGKIIRFNSIPFTIIGTLKEKGEDTFGRDQDDIVIAPYTTVQKRILAITHLNSIQASATSEETADSATEEITTLMRTSHQISQQDSDDFKVFSMKELISRLSQTNETLTVLLVTVASISLLIGGIGIMNIMYVSVKERTREIGLRMSVGARDTDILVQFLIESILISITGGIIGVTIGLASTFFIETFLNWPTEVSLLPIIISFAVCVCTGIFFGWYPAKKASASDPITALRYE